MRHHRGYVPEVEGLQSVVCADQPEIMVLEQNEGDYKQQSPDAKDRGVDERAELLGLDPTVHRDELLLEASSVELLAAAMEEASHEEGPDHDHCQQEDPYRGAERLVWAPERTADVEEENAVVRSK